MINLLIGASAMATILLTVDYVRRHKLNVAWWQWLLTILVVTYATFVVLLIVGFLGEGAGQGALVMSLIMGLPAVIFSVLLVRFVFTYKHKATG